jgi:hypothetical protein
VEYCDTSEGQRPVDPQIRYSREVALQKSEGPAIVPVVFEHHDGPVRWDDLRTTNGIVEGTLSSLGRDDEGIGIFTACETGIASELLHRGLGEWKSTKRGKVIVVCARQDQARKWVGEAASYGNAVIAVSDDGDDAQKNIKRFRQDDECRILVTVAMAYEGLDVPEITHGICLTHIRSVPWIEQMLARAWRKTPTKQECFWWVPDDPRMNRVIARIKAEQPATVIAPSDSGGGTSGERWKVPVSSESVHQRISNLDGAGDCSDTEMVESLLASFGLSELIPDAHRALMRSRNDALPQSEVEGRYRRQLWCEIVRIKSEYGVPYPKVGGKLKSQMGARAENATVEQLRTGIRYAKENWPPINSR